MLIHDSVPEFRSTLGNATAAKPAVSLLSAKLHLEEQMLSSELGLLLPTARDLEFNWPTILRPTQCGHHQAKQGESYTRNATEVTNTSHHIHSPQNTWSPSTNRWKRNTWCFRNGKIDKDRQSTIIIRSATKLLWPPAVHCQAATGFVHQLHGFGLNLSGSGLEGIAAAKFHKGPTVSIV